jgi:hypothetical protein
MTRDMAKVGATPICQRLFWITEMKVQVVEQEDTGEITTLILHAPSEDKAAKALLKELAEYIVNRLKEAYENGSTS